MPKAMGNDGTGADASAASAASARPPRCKHYNDPSDCKYCQLRREQQRQQNAAPTWPEPDAAALAAGVVTAVPPLPMSVLSRVFVLLRPGDIRRCAKVCKAWCQAVDDELLWRCLYTNFFGQPSSKLSPRNPVSRTD